MKKTFFVAGGDARQKTVVRLLQERGCTVNHFGLAPDERPTPRSAAMMQQADVVLLPLPAEGRAGVLNAPLLREEVPLETLWPFLRPEQKIFGGRLSEQLLNDAAAHGLTLTDYFKREDFVLRNAYITAEGAVQRTMEQLRCTVRDTRCLVLGYGRIGKFLARLLRGFGAEVTVAARNSRALAQAQLDGCHSCMLTELKSVLPWCDVIYNTVPHMILDRELLRKVPEHCFCMDLASVPGGIDLPAAEKLGLNTLWASGLPGKTAPESAGKAVLDTIMQILKEQEVPD